MKRAAAAVMVLWAVAAVWAGADRRHWQPTRHPQPVPSQHPSVTLAGPLGRPSPLPDAEAAVRSRDERVGNTATLAGCDPQTVAVRWLGADQVVVELTCPSALRMAQGDQVAVARAWEVQMAWRADGWSVVGVAG
jgi:hypothetical protein